jgi:glutamyl-tRNA reductase
LSNVFLYDLDTLEAIVEENRARRAKEVPKAKAVVQEELNRFFDWHDTLEVVPVVRSLRKAFEDVGLGELKKQSKHFDKSDLNQLEKYTRSLVNKLLHFPTIQVKAIDRNTSEGIAMLAAVRELFQLDVSKEEEESVTAQPRDSA